VDDSTDPKGQPENPDGDTVDDTQDVTFDFAGKVLKESDKSAVADADVTLTWGGTDYEATTDTNGRFVVSGLPYAENGDYTAKIDGKTFTGELPDLGGVENSKTRTASLTAPEIVFLLPSSGTTGTVATPHTITVTKTGSGSVSPAGTVQVSEGGSARIGFAPSSGYTLSEVKIDGTANADAKTNGYYKFTGVTDDHTVAVTFTANSTPGPVNPPSTPTPTPPANVPDRIGGDDRYDTASKITEQAFPDGAIEAIVATGEDFPDAMCAAGLAGLYNCPIVITNTDTLNETSENLLKKLGTTNALVLGGTGAVSENVEERLSTEVTTGGVNRIGGTDRIATALKIAKSAPFDKAGTAIVVNGSRAADALSIAPYAYSDKDPMFLTSADGTLDPESFAEASKYARILIVGGTGVVTVATEDALKAAVGAENVTRLGGANRYDTSAIVASTLFNSYAGTAFASGRDGSYTDALTGAVLCGQKDVPLILVSETASESSGILSDMKSAGVTAGDLFILGGTAAVSDDTVAAIVKALG
jgi:putative cell wall-binding protein